MEEPIKDRPGRTALLKHVVFLVVAALMAYYYAKLRWIMNGEFENGSLENLVNGTADKVFQYRALVPWLVPLVDRAAPVALKSWLSVKSVFDWFRVAETVSAFFLVVAFRRYISFFLGDTTASYVTPFVLFYALPFNFLWPPPYIPLSFPQYLPVFLYHPTYVALFYPYDTPSMMFFTLGLILLYKRRWAPYYLLFAVATLNRETTCFLTFVYVFTAWGRDGKRALALHTAAQFAIWVGIKYALFRLYADNPSQPIATDGPFVNIAHLKDPSNYLYILSNMGFLWVPVLLFWRKIQDDFLRRSLLVLVPYLAVQFLVGQYTELRGFGDVTPVVAAAFVVILKALFEDAGGRRPAPHVR